MNQMEISGLKAVIHTPEKLSGEYLHSLPPYSPCPAYVVDDYILSPSNWMHGSTKSSSYFVPVQEGRGMWFDFTMNNYNTYDIAIVVSVQGINPITGPIKKGHVAELCLEQYVDNCPRHNIAFNQDRYCPKCKYKWPGQNYISSTSGSMMWIDGFRTKNGEVRQYVITNDHKIGVASQLLGDKRMWAIGFAFYKSKLPKPVSPVQFIPMGPHPMIPYPKWKYPTVDVDLTYGYKMDSARYMPSGGILRGVNNTVRTQSSCQSTSYQVNSISSDQLEIAAGARINQTIGNDPNDINYWEDKPSGLIYVNYVSPHDAETILKGGKHKETENGAFANITYDN